MTHVQDRLRSKIKHLQFQIKRLEVQKIELQIDMDKQTSSISGKLRKAEGQTLMDRVDKAIKGSKEDVRLMEMQL